MSDDLGHVFTLREAAEAAEVSISTLKRRLRSGAFPNARQDDGGAWRVPLADLLAAGLDPDRHDEPVADDPERGSITVPLDDLLELERAAARLPEILARLDEVKGERDSLRQLLNRSLPPAPARDDDVVDIRGPARADSANHASGRWWRRSRG